MANHVETGPALDYAESQAVFYLLLNNGFQRFADIGQATNSFHACSFQRSEFLIRRTFPTCDDRTRVTHTLTFRRSHTRDVTHNRLGYMIFNVCRRFFFSATADLTIMTIASVCGSSWNSFRMSMKLEPGIGSPPMPTQVDWPKP